jgi:hypothetical protein
VTNNNGFWIGFTGTSLQLQSIVTAHNQWLSKTPSIPYWTTSVFSSTVTNDKRRIPDHSHESESYVATDGQSASLSWNKAPLWGLRPDFYYCLTVAGLSMWGALSDERMGLSFTTAASPRLCIHSRVRDPWDSRPYFTTSDLRLPLSSTPMTPPPHPFINSGRTEYNTPCL